MQTDKIILASGSPRRKQLLELAHIDFEVISADVDETPPPGMKAEEVPAYLAQKKANAVAENYPGRTIIAADTVVLLDDEILGKPKDAGDAKAILARLSGRMHIVITGVCIQKENEEKVFSAATKVFFRKLTSQQIELYVDQYKPFDKAGAYAIQEYIGIIGIEKIEGDYYNVMGLPVGDVMRNLDL